MQISRYTIHIFQVLQLISLPFFIHAQSNREDVLYLKNGSILRGTIATAGKDSLAIVTREQNRFVFHSNEVGNAKQEKKQWVENDYRNRGFGHYTEIGALAATKNRPDNVTTAAFSFQIVNGYRFSSRIFTGIGIAADLYATQTIIPVFASFRGDLLKNGLFIPYYFADGGYGFDITSSTTIFNYQGGPMFATGLGFKIRFSRVAGFHVNLGYRMQKGNTIESGVKKEYTNNRIGLRAGFYL